MSLARKEIFEFGEFRLDVNEHTIERLDGERNGTLTEKAFQALVLLVRRRGHLVTKDELIRFIWPDTIVEDNNLEKCIHHLRHFLGETPDRTGYIETIRKHGYRFVGNVQAIEVSDSWIPETFRFADKQNESAVSEEDQLMTPEGIIETGSNSLIPVHISGAEAARGAKSPEENRYRLRGALLPAFILALIVGLAGLGYYLSSRSDVVTDGTRSIAVMPLKPIDPANRNDDYGIGTTDSLIQRLSLTKGFVVRQLSAMRKYTEIDQDALAAGREQKVDYVLASGYQFANGRIKVTSQLLDVDTGKVEATFSAETDSADLFSAQDKIANDIGHSLLARFGSEPVEFQAKPGTKNEEAYRLYLRAVNLSEERGIQNVFKSLEYLERAVALDPNYALAWAAKALIHGDIVSHTNGGQHEHFPKSREAIKRALDIEPSLSDAYSALCHYKNRYEYDFAGADAACKRAVELDPNSPVARKTNANFLYTRGRFPEAIVEIKKAIDLQPVSYRNQQIYALTLYYAGRYAEAEEQFKALIELNPNQISYIHGRLIKVLEEQGKESEAFEVLVEKLANQKTGDGTLERFKWVYQKSGWHGVRFEQIKMAEADMNPDYFQLACLHAKAGDKERAFDNLEKNFQERSFLIAILQVEPQLNSLHDDPRFADLIRRVERK